MQLKPGLWPTIRQLKGPPQGELRAVGGADGPVAGTEGPVTGTSPF